jgi:hypothetical protein
MRRTIGLVFFITVGFVVTGTSQTTSTKITRLEVDGNRVKGTCQLFFVTGPEQTEIKAKKKRGGFLLPNSLKGEEYLAVRIRFGKFDLRFPKIHISKFRQDWVVGVDTPPFSDEYVRAEEAATTRRAYYIKFFKQGILPTRLVITDFSL